MSSLKKKTVQGVIWNSSFGLLNQIFTIIIGIALARILDPESFGIIAMVIIVTGYIDLFIDLGFRDALVQQRNTSKTQYNSVFWICFFTGLLFSLVVYFGAPLIALFYELEIIKPISQLLAITFIFKASTIVHQAQLTKTLSFKKLAFIQFSSNLISGFTAIYLALIGFGVWALAWKFALTPIISFIMYWIFHSWRPAFQLNWPSVKQLRNFGLYLTGTRSIHFWTRKIDDLLIGKVIGAVELGFYNRAYFFLMLPLTQIKQHITRVIFPTLSNLQHRKEQAKSVVLKTSATIAFLSFPLILGLFIVSDPFVRVVLGEKWLPILPLIKIFCITAMFQTFYFPAIIFQSQGRADLQFKINIWIQLFQIVCIIVGLYWGIIGVAYGILFSTVVLFYPLAYYSGRLINLRPFEILKAVLPAFLCSLIMAIFVYFVDQGLRSKMDLSLLLLVDILCGGLLYFLIVLVFKPFPFKNLREIISGLLHSKEF